jgi:CRISPR system Cascade subunit CasC
MNNPISPKSIELHILHSFAATNLNRDDTGNPKDCVFGGAHRLRVSSQCLKRAIRHNPVFNANTQVENGVRTKRLIENISTSLQQSGKDDKSSDEMATKFVEAVYSKLDSKRSDLTAVLIYVSPSEIEWITNKLDKAESQEDVNSCAKEIAKILEKRTTSAPDIALFGRMLAEHPDANIDAACQVAHAISTHAVKTETDFFTALDDLKPEDTAGADMIGTIAFGSACYYRYSRLDWQQLVENLGGNTELAAKTVKAFLLASEAANPGGMANSHDNNPRPSLLLGVVRDDSKGAPWSLVNAFEEPIFSRNGYLSESIKRLDSYWQGMLDYYGSESVKVSVVAAHPTVQLGQTLQAVRKNTLTEWVDAILQGLE